MKHSTPARRHATRPWTRLAAAALALGIATASGPLGAAGGGTERTGGSQARVSMGERRAQKATEIAGTAPLEPAFRARAAGAEVYLPTFFHPIDGAYDVVVHFHGLREAQESNVERARVNAVVVSVNLGMGSGPYEEAYSDKGALPRLLGAVARVVDKSGRAPGAHPGRLALSAWSAGYGAVSALLRDPATAKRVDAVLLADGLHSSYANEKRRIVDNAPLQKYARFAEAASRGEKLFVVTHSAITTQGYPSTTETVGALLSLTGDARAPNLVTGPRGMRQLYETHRGELHVRGYEGMGVKDHIDHIWGMSETAFPYLRERWSR